MSKILKITIRIHESRPIKYMSFKNTENFHQLADSRLYKFENELLISFKTTTLLWRNIIYVIQ